jgi:hypothetical protein
MMRDMLPREADALDDHGIDEYGYNKIGFNAAGVNRVGQAEGNFPGVFLWQLLNTAEYNLAQRQRWIAPRWIDEERVRAEYSQCYSVRDTFSAPPPRAKEGSSFRNARKQNLTRGWSICVLQSGELEIGSVKGLNHPRECEHQFGKDVEEVL